MAPIPRDRLDRRLLALGLASSRERAQGLILCGRVSVDGRVVDKPGTPTREDSHVEVSSPEHPFVGRGGMKLAGALAAFPIAVSNSIALDLGASTGGFTDCLLQHGAQRVYAVDVGHGLIDLKLRSDSRVVLLERTNARFLGPAEIPEPIDVATGDLSFISLRLVLPALTQLLAASGHCLLLVKPQFELGRGEVGRGVVRDPLLHARAIEQVADCARQQQLAVLGVAASPIRGAKGNREFFLHLARSGTDLGGKLSDAIGHAVTEGAVARSG